MVGKKNPLYNTPSLRRFGGQTQRKDTHIHRHVLKAGRTQGGSVLADEPAVINEKGSQADGKHGR